MTLTEHRFRDAHKAAAFIRSRRPSTVFDRVVLFIFVENLREVDKDCFYRPRSQYPVPQLVSFRQGFQNPVVWTWVPPT